MQIYTVSQLSNYIKTLLNEDLYLRDIWVTGEVSSLSSPSSGHRYFNFKDNDSEIRAVMFRGNTANGADNLIGPDSTVCKVRNACWCRRVIGGI